MLDTMRCPNCNEVTEMQCEDEMDSVVSLEDESWYVKRLYSCPICGELFKVEFSGRIFDGYEVNISKYQRRVSVKGERNLVFFCIQGLTK